MLLFLIDTYSRLEYFPLMADRKSGYSSPPKTYIAKYTNQTSWFYSSQLSVNKLYICPCHHWLGHQTTELRGSEICKHRRNFREIVWFAWVCVYRYAHGWVGIWLSSKKIVVCEFDLFLEVFEFMFCNKIACPCSIQM